MEDWYFYCGSDHTPLRKCQQIKSNCPITSMPIYVWCNGYIIQFIHTGNDAAFCWDKCGAPSRHVLPFSLAYRLITPMGVSTSAPLMPAGLVTARLCSPFPKTFVPWSLAWVACTLVPWRPCFLRFSVRSCSCFLHLFCTYFTGTLAPSAPVSLTCVGRGHRYGTCSPLRFVPCRLVSLKGQCHEIFDFKFFSRLSFPQVLLSIPLRPSQIFFSRKFAEIFAAL